MRHALLSGFPVRSRSLKRYVPKRATIGEPGHGNIKSLSKLKNETRKSGSDGLGFFWMSAVLWSDSPAAMDIWLERILERYDNSVEFTSPTLPG